MPLGRGIVEVFEAIPDRIEVSGHAPTWRVTGGSFEGVLSFAREAYGDVAVVAREDRSRWWPRVTLTVTNDPHRMAEAPPEETFAVPAVPETPAEPEPVAAVPAPRHAGPRDEAEVPDGPREGATTLEDIFAHQEEARMARHRLPEQRTGH